MINRAVAVIAKLIGSVQDFWSIRLSNFFWFKSYIKQWMSSETWDGVRTKKGVRTEPK